MNSLKHFLKKKIRKLGFRFFPELNAIQLSNPNNYNLRSSVYDSKISKKALIYPLFEITDSIIGDYTYIARNSIVNMTEIGSFCSIGPNLICGWGIHPTNGISTSPMFYSTKKQNGISFSKSDKVIEQKQIKIGNDVFIGANVTILDGVSIGDGAVIGAGAVVSKDIPPYAIAIGCPIRIIRFRFSAENINKLLKIQWWKFDDKKLLDVERLFFDVNEFIAKYEIETA